VFSGCLYLLFNFYNAMKNIYLVGFMGTGKTTIGRELAKMKKMCFADLDELIELKERMSIPDIFRKKGERYFRKVESKVLKEISRENGFVVACGGGIVLENINIGIMKETGLVVCLKASPAVILKRTSQSLNRPLLNTENPKERIMLLLKLRAPYYALADKEVNTSNMSIKETARKVSRMIR